MFLLVFFRSGDCTYDYLKAWETDLRERRPQRDLGTFCGSNHPGLIHTNLDVLNIEFLSDSSIAGNGFRLGHAHHIFLRFLNPRIYDFFHNF